MTTKQTTKATKATTKVATKSAAATKSAGTPKRPMPKGAKVTTPVPVLTIGQAIQAELTARRVDYAFTVSIKDVEGQLHMIPQLTQGSGLRPATEFDLSTLELKQSGKGGAK